MKHTGKRFPLHFQILIAMVSGVFFGVASVYFSIESFTFAWVKPFGTIFIKSLKLIAVPLVLSSIISGIASVSDLGSLSKIGLRTISLYLFTTVVAVSIGLFVVNLIQPWKGFDEQAKTDLLGQYAGKATTIQQVDNKSPLHFIVDMVPSNIVQAMTKNGNMLQIIVFAVLFGIALVMVAKPKAQPVLKFFEGLNEVVLKMVNIIMYLAPIGTFALLTTLIVEVGEGDINKIVLLLKVMGKYCITVIVALAVLAFLFYPILLYLLTRFSPKKFFKGIAPAQALAFSTSSSAATLPVTIQCAEENLKASKEVVGFVLPLGATINMDGTSCYQAVAAVFIANVLGFDLSLSAQLSIVLTATLASIGSAAVPGAGMVMLAAVLAHLAVPVEGIALILGVDRLLDMCRTVVNVTGDLSITVIMDKVFQKLKKKQKI